MTKGAILPSIGIKTPTKDDAKSIYNLVKNSQTLDLNSQYLYLLLCTHFSSSCRIATHKDEIIGFCSSYALPQDPSTLFVWQVVVSPAFKGRGIAKEMIKSVVEVIKPKHISATIAPSIVASRKLFKKLADEYQSELTVSEFFSSQNFSSSHEEELLYTIDLKENR